MYQLQIAPSQIIMPDGLFQWLTGVQKWHSGPVIGILKYGSGGCAGLEPASLLILFT